MSKKMHVWGVIVNGTSHFHVDREGNFYLTGAFEDSVFLTNSEEWIVPMDSTDFFMAKFNPEGQVIWKKLITEMGMEIVFDMEVDPDGFLHILGDFTQTIIIDDTIIDIGEDIQYDESFLAKFSPEGDLIKFMRSGDNQEDVVFISLDLDPQDNIIMRGAAKGSVAFGQALPEPVSEYHYFVAKLKNDFEPIWCIPMSYTEAVKADHESNIYVSGKINVPLTLGDTTLNNPSSCFLVKLDMEGSPVWINSMPKMDYMEIERISLDVDGNVYLTGEWPGDTLFFHNDTVLFNSNGKSFIFKFSEEGDLIWAKALEFRFYSYLVDQTGYFYGAYYFRDTYEDGFVIVNNNGEVIYDEPFDDMEIQDLSMDEEGNIFYHGWFTGNITIEEEEVVPQSGENYLVGQLKADQMISGSTFKEEKYQTEIVVFPNPANERIYIKWPDPVEKLEVTVFDMSGKQVLNKQVEKNSVNITSLSPGFYLVRLQGANRVVFEKIFIQ